MARRRFQFAGAFLYVAARATRDNLVFREREDYGVYLRFLRRGVENGSVRVHAYCLLPDEVHLLLEQPGEYLLSRSMQRLQTSFILYSRRTYGTNGSLFRGRYGAVLVEPGCDLADLALYVLSLPALSGTARQSAGYPWSAYEAYAGRGIQGPVKVVTDRVLSAFAGGPEEKKRAFLAALEKGLPEERLRQIRLARDGAVLGSPGFQQAVLGSAMDADPLPSPFGRSLDKIWSALLQREGLEEPPHGHRRSGLLAEAAYLAVELGLASQSQAGRHFGLTQSAISRAVSRLEMKWSLEPGAKARLLDWARRIEPGKGMVGRLGSSNQA